MRVKLCRLVIALLACSFSVVVAQEDYVSHLVFRNSLTPDSDFNTEGNAVAPSTLETRDGKLPVETAVSLSAPNALRLEWRSAAGGSWDAEIRPINVDNRPSAFIGNTLSFWIYSPKGIASDELPKIRLTDSANNFSIALSLVEFVHEAPAAKWQQVNIPLPRFRSESVRAFDPRRLHSIYFEQAASDDKPHTLIVDDIEIANDAGTAQRMAASPLPAPAALVARGYERHVDLQWKSNDSQEIEYFIVYRSLDGGEYIPVGTQERGVDRYVDFVGKPGVHAAYKVAAVDRQYRQSAFSGTAQAATRELTDDELLTMLQEACFRYYWEKGSHPVAGMALESVPGDPRIVATGASGFGIMAIVVGMDRGFITRQQGVERLTKIVSFLEKADRYHGAWPHFIDGTTGKTMPVFGMFDNGGDIVETSFLVEGLLTARQYLHGTDVVEQALAARITKLWQGVEWDWYASDTKGQAILWHWSPQFSWRLHHKLIGLNETMAAYLLGIASTTHGIPAGSYYSGWASQSEEAAKYRSGWSGQTEGQRYANGSTFEGIKLDVGVGSGGPLFFTQYSFMGPDPHRITDAFTNYFENNRNLALIDYRYCVRNPGKYAGYGPGAWGLTASLDPDGYGAHAPDSAHDNGTISPTAALGAFPYTPEESLAALKYIYREVGDRAWGIYGPVDGFNVGRNWFAPIYLGLDQAPITVMVENYRSGLIWKTFMANPEMAHMLEKIRRRSDSVAGSK